MAHYTNLLIARQGATSEVIEAIVEQNGGKIEKIENWGFKSLAYRIRKNRKAHFTLLNIDAPPAALAEMERQMQVSEDVLRFMTIHVEQSDAESVAVPATKNASPDLQTELDAYSRTILAELRELNEHLESRL